MTLKRCQTRNIKVHIKVHQTNNHQWFQRSDAIYNLPFLRAIDREAVQDELKPFWLWAESLWRSDMSSWLHDSLLGERSTVRGPETQTRGVSGIRCSKGNICELDYIKTNMDIKYFSFSVLTYFNHSVNLPTVVTWLNEMGDVLTITDQFPENIECRSHPHEPPSRTHYAITIRGPCPGVTGAQFEVIMRGECVIRRMRPHIVWYEA